MTYKIKSQKNQMGFSAIYIVIILLLVGFGFLVYIYYQKHQEKQFNAESYAQLENLSTKFDNKMRVAESTPRIGLGSVLNDLATVQSEIDAIEVSDCLTPAKESLERYTSGRFKYMMDFAANKMDESNADKYQQLIEESQNAMVAYVERMQECKPE